MLQSLKTTKRGPWILAAGGGVLRHHVKQQPLHRAVLPPRLTPSQSCRRLCYVYQTGLGDSITPHFITFWLQLIFLKSLDNSFWLLPLFKGEKEKTALLVWRALFVPKTGDKFILQIFSQCICISNHHIVPIKTYYNCICQLTSMKLKRKNYPPALPLLATFHEENFRGFAVFAKTYPCVQPLLP